MGNAIFPYFRGFQWPNNETVITSTKLSKHVSGRVVAAQLYKYPLYSIELDNTWLSASKRETDWNLGKETLQKLQAFFLNRAGQFDPFCLRKSDYTGDPCDSRAEGAQIGVGNGNGSTNQVFTFQRWLASNSVGNPPYNEPVGQVEPVGVNLYVGGVYQDPGRWYLIYPNQVGFYTFAAPGDGVAVTADYGFYFRVRFADDMLECVNSAKFLWQVKKLGFVTAKFP